MLVNYVSFLDPRVYGGGGEMITRRLIEVGASRGHDIRITSARPRREALHTQPDVTLLADMFNYARTYMSLGAWRSFASRFMEGLSRQRPFVHITTAYADVCNLGHLPCSGNAAEQCPFKPLPLGRQALMRDFSGQCFATRAMVRHLYQTASLNVFLSPLHKNTTERVLGSPLGNSFILKPTIDTSLFRNSDQRRDIEYLFVGLICEAKGLAEMRQRFGDSDIHLIGPKAPDAQLDFGRYLGRIPNGQLPGWMQRARNFVFLPRWPEPQGRVVAEAALCGCNIIGNGNVGALSFHFDLSDPAQYTDAEAEFWKVVEAIDDGS